MSADQGPRGPKEVFYECFYETGRYMLPPFIALNVDPGRYSHYRLVLERGAPDVFVGAALYSAWYFGYCLLREVTYEATDKSLVAASVVGGIGYTKLVSSEPSALDYGAGVLTAMLYKAAFTELSPMLASLFATPVIEIGIQSLFYDNDEQGLFYASVYFSFGVMQIALDKVLHYLHPYSLEEGCKLNIATHHDTVVGDNTTMCLSGLPAELRETS